ncbi:MAG TPA: 4Fe-4S binding protein [Bacteroidales bacterium]|nr:4Fe-4S binding protein [Bacteroidales bacterium]
MIREIVKINEELCNGCGECVPNCHEGALQIIDGKARLISDLMCDGLGACLGHCPLDAITVEKREAEPYDEKKVMAIMVEKGKKTVIAHLKHLLEHNETEFYGEAIEYLELHQENLPFTLNEIAENMENKHEGEKETKEPLACGCPGSMERSFNPAGLKVSGNGHHDGRHHDDAPSQLSQWPVQMHLINPAASFFRGADVVLSADCVGYALGNFHQKYLKGKSLAIACPKLDHGPDVYIEKIRQMIDEAKINTLHLIIMQVPCCGGLRQMVSMAQQQAGRKVPVKQTVVSVEGEVISEEWI